MLFKDDLDEIIPKGLAPEDSTLLAKQYINTWASDIIFQKIAEQQLSKSEKDVSKELEDYRKSLLKYRYEQLYVNERLDTAVNEELVEEYFQKHSEKFILERPILKARYLCITEDSPAIEQIKKKMSSQEVDDLVEADSLAYSSAMKFSTWKNEWIDVVTLAIEYNVDHKDLLGLAKGRWIEQKGTDGFVRIAYLSEIKQKGEMAPLEYCAPAIKEIIVSARKQTLISGLEQDLLNDALENGKFRIY